MGYDTSVPLEQTMVLEKVNPVTDSPLPTTLGSGLTTLELLNKLLRVVNEAVGNDVALSKNFTALLSAFEELRAYVADHGFGDGSVTGDVIADGTISAAKLAPGCVTTEKLNTGAVTEVKLADGCVTTKKLADRCVSDKKLAFGSVTDRHLTGNSVGKYHIMDGVVEARHLDPNLVMPETTKGVSRGYADVCNTNNGELLATLATLFEFVSAYVGRGENAIAPGKLSVKSGGTVHMGDNVVSAVGEPVADTDAANKKYVDDRTGPLSVTTDKLADGAVTGDKLADELVLPRGTTTTTYDVFAPQNQGTRVATIGSIRDYLTSGRGTLRAKVTSLTVTDELQFAKSGHISMAGSVVQNIGAPQFDTDAANKEYVDTHGAPLVLYALKSNENPAHYLSDAAYGNAALKAIMQGKQILVRVPPANLIEGEHTPEEYAAQYTALFSPVLTYQLPNNAGNEYLYLFYLRDEKQVLDLSAMGMGTIQLPVYGELKLKVSVDWVNCPLDNLSGQVYYDIVHGSPH